MRLALFLLCTVLMAREHVIVVGGLGGDPEYDQRFQQHANEIAKLTREAGANVIVLAGAEATKAKLLDALRATGATAEDQVVLMLVGHGTYDEEFKFNIPGPDITAQEMARAMDALAARKQAVIVMSSASGAAKEALEKQGRVVITATRSGTEKNAPVFARYWAEALRGGAADRDKDEMVTALEAFQYASTKVKQYYESAGRLATEHPTLEKNAEQAAARIVLTKGESVKRISADPAKQKLLARRTDVEARIDALKLKKAAMPEDQYRKQMQGLLVELAKVQAEIDQ